MPLQSDFATKLDNGDPSQCMVRHAEVGHEWQVNIVTIISGWVSFEHKFGVVFDKLLPLS